MEYWCSMGKPSNAAKRRIKAVETNAKEAQRRAVPCNLLNSANAHGDKRGG
jgi:hypothetical protein